MARGDDRGGPAVELEGHASACNLRARCVRYESRAPSFAVSSPKVPQKLSLRCHQRVLTKRKMPDFWWKFLAGETDSNPAMKQKTLARLDEPRTRLRRYHPPDALLSFLQRL